jgi:PST family polysaccharide transporter
VLWRTAREACPPPAIAHVDRADLRQLVSLGGALMVVGWLGQLSAYVVRLAIVRQEGLEAAGYYQAAFAISGSLPGFVFAAMGADFFPRVAAAKDEEEAHEVTEKQVQAALLLGVPIIAGLISGGEIAIRLLYADTFKPASDLLIWTTWGVFVRLFTWPIGFRLLARGSAAKVVLIEASACIFMSLSPILLMPILGLSGAGVGFLTGNLAYAALLLSMSGFARRWRAKIVGACIGSTLLLLLVQKASAVSHNLGYACTIMVIGCFAYFAWRKIKE